MRQLEAEHRDRPFGDWWNELFGLGVVSVTLAGMALEALANEVLSETIISRLDTVGQSGVNDDLFETFERNNVKSKILLVYLVQGQDPPSFHKRLPLVLTLRNELVHYKAHWVEPGKKHGYQKLSKKLSRILRSPDFVDQCSRLALP